MFFWEVESCSLLDTYKILQEPVDFIFTVEEVIFNSIGGGSWHL